MLQNVNNHTMLDDVTYKRSKHLSQIYIPGASALYFIVGNAAGFPGIEPVVGSLAILSTIIGVMLYISSSAYRRSEAGYDGNVIIQTTQNGGKLFSLELGGDPEEIEEKSSVSFKVKCNSESQNIH
jgi:Putative phage holin Dp-1